MGFLSTEQRYNMLRGIKYGTNPNLPKGPLTDEEESFVRDYAMKKIDALLKDQEARNILAELCIANKAACTEIDV